MSQFQRRKEYRAPEQARIVPQPAPLQAAPPINPNMELTRYNTAAGGEFTIDATGRLTRRAYLEEEARTGKVRPMTAQNPLLVPSALTIASADKPEADLDGSGTKGANQLGVMKYVNTHPQLVIDYADI